MPQAYYSPMTVNAAQVPSTQTNFPKLSIPTDNRFRTIGNGGHVANVNGFDIRPYSDAGLTTPLTYELVYYNPSTGQFEMHVNIPSLSNGYVTYFGYGDTTLTTDGSSALTWANAFTGVYHLKDGTTLSVTDSTGNHNGTNSGCTATAGQIDGGAAFVSASSFFINTNTTNGTAALTFSGWINATTLPNPYNTAFFRNPDGVQFWGILIKSTGKLFASIKATTELSYDGTGSHTLSTGTWYLIHLTYDSTAGLIAYVNGSSDGTVSANGASSTVSAEPIYLGRDHINSRYWNGSQDEFRVSSVARAQDWVTTEYNNQSVPSTFETLGAEVNLNPMVGLFTYVSFLPTDITGLKLWLKADSLVLNDGDSVSTWTDSSGSGTNVTGVTTTRPLYKTGIINGLPSVLFDGTDDFLNSASGLAALNSNSQFIVIQPTLDTASQKTYSCMAHYGGKSFMCAKVSTNVWGTFAGAGDVGTTALTSGSNYLVECTTPNATLYQRGVGVGGSGTSVAGPVGSTSVGIGKDLVTAGREYAGHIAEVIVYNTVLSNTDRIRVENYLINKYAL